MNIAAALDWIADHVGDVYLAVMAVIVVLSVAVLLVAAVR